MTTRSSNQPFFTVVIPTRERADVLYWSIQTALAQQWAELEVLVCDNCSTDDTEAVVNAFSDSRLHYIRTPKRLSMSHNWEFALSHVKRGWVTLMGDDDGLLPNSLEKVANIIAATGTSFIRSNSAYFAWPYVQSDSQRHGRLTVSLERGYRQCSSRDSLKKVLLGLGDYRNLPMFYNGGYASTELIELARDKSGGNLYRSMTPDLYSAAVFSMLIPTYVYSREPLAINGASKHSGGTATMSGAQRSGENNPARKFTSEPNIPFHSAVPKMNDGTYPLSLDALFYETYCQAADIVAADPVLLSAETQLRASLGRYRRSQVIRDNTLEWARLFANHHKLDFAASLRRSRPQYLRSFLQELALSARQRISHVTVEGNSSRPLLNVLEASRLAGEIVDSPKGPLRRLGAAAGQALSERMG